MGPEYARAPSLLPQPVHDLLRPPHCTKAHPITSPTNDESHTAHNTQHMDRAGAALHPHLTHAPSTDTVTTGAVPLERFSRYDRAVKHMGRVAPIPLASRAMDHATDRPWIQLAHCSSEAH